jgi:tetratricopeptide (TPR) repeat protein
VNPHLMVVLVGLFYILIIGGISLLRREGLSMQLALESLLIIALAVLLGSAAGTSVDPIILFIILYLITMRARLLTDLANLLFKRRGYATAASLYRLALRLFPDRTARHVVLVNWGVARLQTGDVEGAIATLQGVLTSAHEQGGLGHKYEAACCYNLALAYRKAGEDVKAVLQLNQVIELFPASVYSQAAERLLKQRRERDASRDASDKGS